MGNRVIYFDLDGVVAQFVTGVFAVHGKSLPIHDVRWNFMLQMGFHAEDDPAFWTPLENAHFWRNLAPHADGMELFRRVTAEYGDDAVSILSSAMVRCSADGKRDWLKRHMPTHHDCAIFATKKYRLASPCKLLIDDNDGNVRAFREKGGRAVLVPRPWNERRSECLPGGEFDVDAVWREVRHQVEGG